jgi:hypothetical protein
MAVSKPVAEAQRGRFVLRRVVLRQHSTRGRQIPIPRPGAARRPFFVAHMPWTRSGEAGRTPLRSGRMVAHSETVHLDEASPLPRTWPPGGLGTRRSGQHRGDSGNGSRTNTAALRFKSRRRRVHRPSPVPIPVAETADDAQLGTVDCQHVRSEVRFGAKSGRLPVQENATPTTTSPDLNASPLTHRRQADSGKQP